MTPRNFRLLIVGIFTSPNFTTRRYFLVQVVDKVADDIAGCSCCREEEKKVLTPRTKILDQWKAFWRRRDYDMTILHSNCSLTVTSAVVTWGELWQLSATLVNRLFVLSSPLPYGHFKVVQNKMAFVPEWSTYIRKMVLRSLQSILSRVNLHMAFKR